MKQRMEGRGERGRTRSREGFDKELACKRVEEAMAKPGEGQDEKAIETLAGILAEVEATSLHYEREYEAKKAVAIAAARGLRRCGEIPSRRAIAVARAINGPGEAPRAMAVAGIAPDGAEKALVLDAIVQTALEEGESGDRKTAREAIDEMKACLVAMCAGPDLTREQTHAGWACLVYSLMAAEEPLEEGLEAALRIADPVRGEWALTGLARAPFRPEGWPWFLQDGTSWIQTEKPGRREGIAKIWERLVTGVAEGNGAPTDGVELAGEDLAHAIRCEQPIARHAGYVTVLHARTTGAAEKLGAMLGEIANALGHPDPELGARTPKRARLLPPRAFSEVREPPPEGIDPELHPVVEFAIESARRKNPEPAWYEASIKGFSRAAAGHRTDENELLSIKAVLDHAGTAELLGAAREGAYSMRSLVRMMHAARGQFGHDEGRILAVNACCLPEWNAIRRSSYEPKATKGGEAQGHDRILH